MAAEQHKNIVPCLVWVKQGCAKRKPDKVTLDKEELKKIIEKTQQKLDGVEDSEEELEEEEDLQEENNEEPKTEDVDFAKAIKKAQSMASSIKEKGKRKRDEGANPGDDIEDKYGLDDYDDDESPMDFLQGIGGLTPFASNEEDPYITLKNDEDSDDEDFELKPTDNLITVGRLTEEAAVLEVHIYNAEANNMFIHHDYILPTFPLVLEWLDYDVADADPGNFVAMGTMEPDISVWDLDVVDSLEPVCVLKGDRPKKTKKKKKKESLGEGHSDAVLDLSWNTHVRNVLASGSADTTVRLWDLAEGKSVSTLEHHKAQVQCVSWHPVESQSLLTGGFDKTAAVIDCRSPSENVKKWLVNGEVERAVWDHFQPFQFLASTDQGTLYCMDVREDKPVFQLSAHEQAVTGVALSSQIPGLLVTTSPDKHLKVWDLQGNKPSLVLNRNLHMDILHCTACNPDEPFVFAIGANKNFKVWDIRESASVRKHFISRMPQRLAAECEGDDEDLPDDAEAAAMMENLNMEDAKDLAEEQEMLTGDRGAAASGDAKKKKKKKKKKKPVDS